MIRQILSKLHFTPFTKKPALLFCSSKITELTTQIRSDLISKLESMEIRIQKSVILQQPLQKQLVNEKWTTDSKKRKKVYKILSESQKQELGLLVPHPPFNLRMTRKSEQQYRKQLCQDLYTLQKQKLETSVRILQLQNTTMNVDQYINSTYKDIFARFMVSRGYGVQWEATNSKYGVMNQADKNPESIKNQMQEFYSWLLQLIEENPLEKKQILGLYSYAMKNYTPISGVDVENVQRMGYFFTMPITKFGKFRQSFEVIQDRGQSIDLLVMLQDPIKLLNIEAICIEPNKKMIILSKYQQGSTNTDETQIKTNSYLITSMDIYMENREYFNQNGYTKHLLFESEHLLEMEVCQGIKIFNQISGYSRKGGAYVIDRFSGLPDFQRSQQLELKIKNQYINQDGVIDLSQITSDNKQILKITDPKHTEKFLNIYNQIKSPIKKIDLYSTYQDQIYSFANQKLHFKKADKYVIPIPESNHQQLEQILAKTIVQQSKVKIPRLQRIYPKPRDRRRDKKRIRNLSQQQTNYMSLKESLSSISELSFSRIENSTNNITIPLFISQQTIDNVKQKKILINSRIRQVLMESIRVTANENSSMSSNKFNLNIQWNIQKINSHLELLNQEQKQNNCIISIKLVQLTSDLFHGYRCFRNYLAQPELTSIVVEPQSKTEDVVPFFFHLHLMLHKMMLKRSQNAERGRRVQKRKLTNKMFSLVKFHPTIDQSQRNKQIQQILFGVFKANNQQQHGYGLQALRLWIARHDSYLGDRKISQKQVNKQLQLSAFIRKMYWQILPLMQVNLDKIRITNQSEQIELHNQSSKVPREKLTYLHRFMLDHINYYVLNMEECYTRLDISRALQLTQDFYKNYLSQIFLKNIRKRIINYPLNPQTKQHIYVLRKILDLVAVVAPLLPYSVYHITKSQMMQWPEIVHEQVRTELIPNYNRMTKLRVQVRNKFMLNDFKHSQLVIPIEQVKQSSGDSVEFVSEIWKLSKQDLQLFFDIENISIQQPQQQGKSFKLKLTQHHPVGEVPSLKFYQFKQICVRCSPTHHYGTHICQKCLNYLNNNFGKSLPIN